MSQTRPRREILKIGLAGITLLSGCTSFSSVNTEAQRETKTDVSPGKVDCSDATLSDPKITPLTSGDTLVVTGRVFHTPAPDLRGYIIERSCPEQRRDIHEPLDSIGDFRFTFEYGHHGIKDSAFWLEGCESPTPEPETTDCSDSNS